MRRNRKKRGVNLRDDDGISLALHNEYVCERSQEYWDMYKSACRWSRPVSVIDGRAVIIQDYVVFEDGVVLGPRGQLP